MPFKVGDEIVAENSWKLRTSLASRSMRTGTILEVIGEGRRTRYRIRWHNHGGGDSIYHPLGDSMRLASDRNDAGFSTS
jgi:hypothetical protein